MSKLEQIAKQIESNKQPPVHLWKPEIHGSIDIKINAQGFWFHEGEPISRDKLVALFASILWAEGNLHYLVTPLEKLKIDVEDVPYLIHQAEYVEEVWIVVTNTHEQVIVGESNPVELRDYQGVWLPYIKVRYDLWARVNRSIYYQWADSAIDRQVKESDPLTLSSGDYRFEVARVVAYD